jgi:hypothetical protein
MWLRHPNYDNTNRSNNVDIAHLYLQDPTDTGVFTGSYQNQIVEVVGWGKTESGVDSNSLRKLSIEQHVRLPRATMHHLN